MASYNLQKTLEQLKLKAKEKRKENIRFFKSLKRIKPQILDAKMHALHDEVFKYTDCLTCGNCCRTTGPLLTKKDIERLAKHLSMKAAQFEETYLRVDEDNDFVFKSMPCPFLGDDNYCAVYDYRPKACREFPHTDRMKQHQILELTRKNVAVCPAIFEITERLKREV